MSNIRSFRPSTARQTRRDLIRTREEALRRAEIVKEERPTLRDRVRRSMLQAVSQGREWHCPYCFAPAETTTEPVRRPSAPPCFRRWMAAPAVAVGAFAAAAGLLLDPLVSLSATAVPTAGGVRYLLWRRSAYVHRNRTRCIHQTSCRAVREGDSR